MTSKKILCFGIILFLQLISFSYLHAEEPDYVIYFDLKRERAVEIAIEQAEHNIGQKAQVSAPIKQKAQKKPAPQPVIEQKKEERPAPPAPPPSPAGPLRLSGYLKDIFSASRTMGTGQHYYSNLQRTRVEAKKELGNNMKADVSLDNEFLIGDFFKTPEYHALRSNDQHQLNLVDLDKVYATRSHVDARVSVYRAFVKYDNPEYQATIGRQMIDWGRTKFYSPTDLFNPINPLTVEKDERMGVDAVNVEFTMKDAKYDAIAAPMRTLGDSSFGIRRYWRQDTYDMFLMAADIRNDAVVGYCFDGYYGKAGLRGEFTQTHSEHGRNYPRATIGLDYNFPNKIYLLCEYFYNGGADDNNPEQFAGSYLYASRTLSQHRNLFSTLVEYEVHPLVKWYNYLIYDLDKGSVYFNPELKYNIITNFDLSVGAQLYAGSVTSEFGNYQNLYYTQAQYFF